MSELPDPVTAADLPSAGPSRRKSRKGLLACLLLLWIVLGAAVITGIFLGQTTGWHYDPIPLATSLQYAVPASHPPDAPETRKLLLKQAKALKKTRPRKVFVVVDRVHNQLDLRDGDQVLLKAVISCGAGSVLEDQKSGRKWVFDTPMGRFRVVNKRSNPRWTAPDWEYIETNEPLPRSYSDRVQEGMLGEYALDLNLRGYMIHGTLYSRLLGRSVSHGCIRVGRDDLRVLWKRVPIGTDVFIF